MKISVGLRRMRELLIFTENEKRGIIVLLCLIFLLVVTDILLPVMSRETKYDFTEWENEIDQYLGSQKSAKFQDRNEGENFDPNQIDSVTLVKKGVPSRVARNWCKYLDRGGRFKRKEDLTKIYGMTLEVYHRLEKFVVISPDPVKKGKPSPVGNNSSLGLAKVENTQIRSKKIYEPVNLNEADSAQLENLPGIGPVLAPRIIRFGKILGGFYSVEQLREVYGMREENFLAAYPHLFVKGESCQKFNINFATLTEMGHHPYIGYRTARRIVDHRDRRGKFTAANELSTLMGEDSLKKVMPYLVFGP